MDSPFVAEDELKFQHLFFSLTALVPRGERTVRDSVVEVMPSAHLIGAGLIQLHR